jgi:exonuclease III
VEQFVKRKHKKRNNFSIFHLNIASLQYHFEDLKILLSSLEHDFDIISISETKLKQNSPPVIDINIPNYQFEHTPSDANKGGTLLYISNIHNYKPRMDLKAQLYESKQVESTFIEIINPKGKNTIIGSIYKHFTISQKYFTDKISQFLANVSKENKPCYLSGDFNMNLLSIDDDAETERFFDSLTDKQFMPLITVPTRIAKTSKTLIDNIFYNQFSNDIISGNLTVGISDHMPQFCIIHSDQYTEKKFNHQECVQTKFQKL